jgi:hypothetical protein
MVAIRCEGSTSATGACYPVATSCWNVPGVIAEPAYAVAAAAEMIEVSRWTAV